jgi:hypothetical protein
MSSDANSRWSPLTGYGEEGKRHPMLSVEDGKIKVDYEYDGEDKVTLNTMFMPIRDDVITFYHRSEEAATQVRLAAWRAKILYFEMDPPLLYALFYSKLGVKEQVDTITIVEGFERMIFLGHAKYAARQDEKEIGTAIAELGVEMDALTEELLTKFKDPVFKDRDEETENAIVELLLPFTFTYIAILERACWRLYGQFTEAEHAHRPSTVRPASLESEPSVPDQDKYCKALWALHKKNWTAQFGEEIPLDNTFDLTEDSFVNSRYHYGASVAQALFLFDLYQQESLLELVEKKE